MTPALISMLHSEIASESNAVNFASVNEKAMKIGYIIHPNCCSKDIERWITVEKLNTNKTFYKTWSDITSKTRFELFVDQILHYATTYGINNNVDNGYVPNTDTVEIPYEKFKVITPITVDEAFDKLYGMLTSGAALSSATINEIVDFIEFNNLQDKVNPDEIKNKEAQAIVSVKTKRLPKDEFGLLRAIVYEATGSAMLIKSKESIEAIKEASECISILNYLRDDDLVRLSHIFYRYKPLFLAMKSNSKNSHVINRIRKLAVKNHTPLKAGFWETVLNPAGDGTEKLEEARRTVSEINNFKKVQLIQAIASRLECKGTKGKMFVIRNGKMYVREGYEALGSTRYLITLSNIITEALIDSLKKKACSVKMPAGVNIACPTSEKNFIGNYPMGTSVDLSDKNNVIGIYWRGEWGTEDFDLSLTDDTGRSFSWCSDYQNETGDVIYSGDMTRANPEAAELFYIGKKVPDGIIKVNKYWGNDESSQFKLFVATEDMTGKLKPDATRRRDDDMIMCDPNNIKFEAMVDHSGSNEKTAAYIHNGKVYLMNFASGNSRIARTTSLNDIVQTQMKATMDTILTLRDILSQAGFDFVEGNADLDLTNPDKNAIISLFA